MTGAEPGRQSRPDRQGSPGGFFYERLMPWLLAGLGLVLAGVVLLSVAAMLGLFPPG
jgi:hypothetical protein